MTDNMANGSNVTLQDEEDTGRAIEVRGLPAGVTEDIVSLYFESVKKSGGGPVEKIELKGDGTALVWFEDRDVFLRVVNNVGSVLHVIANHKLDVSEYKPQLPQPAKGETAVTINTITVRGFGRVTDDTLKIYFENKRSGGGDVTDVRRGSDGDVVYITFENQEVAQRVAEQRHHAVGIQNLDVSLYTPAGPPDTITVQGFGSVTDEVLKMYFENKQSGGGDVKVVDRRSDPDVVYVTFENQEVVENVCNKSHKIDGNNLQVAPFIKSIPISCGHKRNSQRRMEQTMYSDFTDMMAETAKEANVTLSDDENSCQTIQVKGLQSWTTKDTVSRYFQDKKRSRGGPIEKIELKGDGTAIVCFEDKDVFLRVLNTAGSVLHVIDNHKVDVSEYKPHKPKPVTDETAVTTDTITVQGCDSVTDDFLKIYFENKRSGGGDVKDVTRGSDPDVVYITFENHEVARRVAEQRHHAVGAQNLDVSLYTQAGPPDTITVQGFGSVTDDTLKMYFENKRSGGGDVKGVRRGSDPEVVYITFENHEVVKPVCNTAHTIEGNSLKVEQFIQQHSRSCSDTTRSQGQNVHSDEEEGKEEDGEDDDSAYVLEVKGIPEIMSEDTLLLYFENRRRSGGGNVECLEIDRDTGRALVYFEEGDVVQRVVQKAPHLLEKIKLEVSEYQYSYNRSTEHRRQESPLKGTAEGTAVEITGVDEGTSEETLLLYFENKRRSGGQNVKELITVDSEEGTKKYVVYETKREAETVAIKQHIVDGCSLKVRMYCTPTPLPPQPKYPDRFLISGLKDTTGRDALKEFIWSKLGCDPKDIVYGEEPGTVLVSVSDQNILSKLKTMKRVCKKRPLEGAFLEISDISISNCILVRGLDQKISAHMLGLYFESRRSGNSMEVEVEKVEMDSNHALIFFKNHEVIPNILKKTQNMYGVPLEVSLYNIYLGVEGGHKEPSGFSVPPPITLDNLDPYKLKFIRESKSNLKNLKEQLEDGYSVLRWDSEESVVLKCTLSKYVPGAREIAKKWKREAEDDFNNFLSLLISEKMNVLQEVWSDVMAKIGGLNMPGLDAATIYTFDQSQLVVVVGHTMVTEGLIKQVKETVSAVEEEHERKQKEITETVGCLKSWQVHFLIAIGFHTDMMKKYPTLKVQILASKKEITFEGLMSDVKNVKIHMYEFVNRIKDTTLTSLSNAHMKLLLEKNVRHYIVKKLKQKAMVGVWNADNGKLKVYARSDLEVANVAHILKQSVCEQVINLDPESVPLLKSTKWVALYDEQTKRQGDKVKIIAAADKSRIVIVAIDGLIVAVAEAVNNFLRDNTVYSNTVRFPKGVQRFMTEYMDAHVSKLASKFQGYSAEISVQEQSLEFTVKATKDGMSIITSELVKLSEKILHKSHVFCKPGIAKLIRSEKGDQHISNTEKLERCVIEKYHNDQELVVYVNQKQQRALWTGTGVPKSIATCDLRSGHTLSVLQGDITQMRVDAIVNAANQQLAHIGGVARAIVDRGGHVIQAESDKIRSSQGDIDVGEVAVTGPGQLPCKIVIHAVGPIWGGGKKDEEGLLQEAIFNSMEKADNYQLTSIAIPALSTGVYGYPIPAATKAIVDAVQKHFQDNPTSQVQDVYLCDNNDNTVQEFVNAVIQRFGRSNVQSKKAGRRTHTYSVEQEREKPSYQSQGRHRQQRASSHHETSLRSRGKAIDSRINIRIVTNEIAMEQVDVIVNTTSPDLDLSHGAVSNSLLQAGGSGIQEECKKKYPNGIKSGELAITSGGNLQCQLIYHTCLPSWTNGPKMLEDLVEACLQEASQCGCTSLAFPAMGTGNLGYPKDIVAKTMFETVEQFSRSSPSSSVKEVKIVLYHRDTDTIKAFQVYQGKPAPPPGGTTWKRGDRTFDESATWQHVTTSDLNDVFIVGNVKLTVKQGDLTKEQADCIVNSTNIDFDLRTGAVSQSIMEAGGQDLMQEVALKKDDMKNKGIAVTTAKGLAADYIVHVAVDISNEDWKKIISKSLKEATKTVGVSSVAFPALGTGRYKRDPEDMAKILIDVLDDCQKYPPRSGFIRDVRVVIYQKDMLGPFINGIHKAVSAGRGGKNILHKFIDWFKNDDRDGDAVTLHFFSTDQPHIEKAIDRLDRHYDDNVMQKVISDEVLKGLHGNWGTLSAKKQMFDDTTEKDAVDDLRVFGVKVDYNARLGRVRLRGLTTDVIKAVDAVHSIIIDVQRHVQESEKAEMLSSYVQWSFIDVDSSGSEKYVEYDKITNRTIESAYKGGKQTASIKGDDNVSYIIDFAKMVEYPFNDATDKVTVVRKDLIKGTTFQAPTNWLHMTSDSEMIAVPSANKEHTDVEQHFTATLGRPATIVKIERVQTKFLWQQYVAKKQQLDNQNPGHQNEKILWHGTSADAIPSIYKGGFNRSYCGKNATALGMGVYFAVNASYSAADKYSVPNQQGHKHMFMARVLTGIYTQGQNGMRVPPVRDAARHISFDSVVDNPAGPGMYVIFNDTQAYPEFLITFF